MAAKVFSVIASLANKIVLSHKNEVKRTPNKNAEEQMAALILDKRSN